MKLSILYNQDKDQVVIEGITYTGDFFRSFSNMLIVDDLFRFVKREDGSVTVQVIRPEMNT